MVTFIADVSETGSPAAMKNSTNSRTKDGALAADTRIAGIHSLSDSLKLALMESDRLGLTKVGIHVQEAWTACEAAKLLDSETKEDS